MSDISFQVGLDGGEAGRALRGGPPVAFCEGLIRVTYDAPVLEEIGKGGGFPGEALELREDFEDVMVRNETNTGGGSYPVKAFIKAPFKGSTQAIRPSGDALFHFHQEHAFIVVHCGILS